LLKLEEGWCSLLHHYQKIHELIILFYHLLTHSTTNSGVVGAGACMYNYIFTKTQDFSLASSSATVCNSWIMIRSLLEIDSILIREEKPKDAQKALSERFFFFYVSLPSKAVNLNHKHEYGNAHVINNMCLFYVHDIYIN
jgi:hypothetical protein